TPMTRFVRCAATAAACLLAATAEARGASPYLPLDQSPDIERKIERVMILAGQPILTRPIAAATVLDALPAACERDAALCEQVRHYLGGFMKTAGIAHLSAAAAVTSDEAAPLHNRHGMRSDSQYEVSARLYWQRSDHVLLSAGFTAYEDETVPTGSLVSIGWDFAQLDVGWRGHWLSPMTDSAMLLGTQAQTMPSITLSNYKPLSRLGFRYQLFFAKMSESDDIRFEGGVTTGEPRLAGMHVSIEPVPGWTLGANRIMQYGGGERGNDSFSDLIDA